MENWRDKKDDGSQKDDTAAGSQELNRKENQNIEEQKEEPALRDDGNYSVKDNQMEHSVTTIEEDKVIVSVTNKKEGDEPKIGKLAEMIFSWLRLLLDH